MGKFLGINETGHLVTAVKKYSLGVSEVTLVSSTHIGEVEYYNSLKGICEGMDCVLWEGAMSTEPSTDEGRKAHRIGKILREGYRDKAKHYGLQYMKDVFDPEELHNGEHCDISSDCLGEEMGEEDLDRIQSIVSSVLPSRERMKALAYTSSCETPIDRKRNDIVNKRLGSAKGKTAVLYGANHMKHFEKRLLELGYFLESERWLVAIE